jgi:putative membrane protein
MNVSRSGSAGLILLSAVALTATPGHAQNAPHLSDAEIAHVAVTANAIDIELAALAPSRASDGEVAAFARTMVTDHTAVNERAAALAARLGVVPANNDVSRSLRDGAHDARQTLEATRGESFDVAYMEREVAYHQAVLEALDGILIPQTRNAELRGLLEEVRPAIAAHLNHARSIHGRLQTGG